MNADGFVTDSSSLCSGCLFGTLLLLLLHCFGLGKTHYDSCCLFIVMQVPLYDLRSPLGVAPAALTPVHHQPSSAVATASHLLLKAAGALTEAPLPPSLVAARAFAASRTELRAKVASSGQVCHLSHVDDCLLPVSCTGHALQVTFLNTTSSLVLMELWHVCCHYSARQASLADHHRGATMLEASRHQAVTYTCYCFIVYVLPGQQHC